MRRNLSSFEVAQIDRLYSESYSLDMFFVESMACLAGISRGYLQNLIYSGSASFIRRLDCGHYGTCASSMVAFGEMLRENDQRRANQKSTEPWVTKP